MLTHDFFNSKNYNQILDTFCFKNDEIYLKKYHIERSFQAYSLIDAHISYENILDFYSFIEKQIYQLSQNLSDIHRLILSPIEFEDSLTFVCKNNKILHYKNSHRLLDPIQKPIKLSVYSLPDLDSSNELSYYKFHQFKWSYRHFWDFILKHKKTEAHDVLLLNSQLQIVETSRFNVFIFDSLSNKIKTPTLKSGCLNGVFRRFALEQKFLKINNIGKKSVVEEDILWTNLYQSNYQIFLGNSIRDLVPAELIR